jgi:hypothetical protein
MGQKGQNPATPNGGCLATLASLLRAMTQPSLLDKTITGRWTILGLKTRSHDA